MDNIYLSSYIIISIFQEMLNIIYNNIITNISKIMINWKEIVQNFHNIKIKIYENIILISSAFNYNNYNNIIILIYHPKRIFDY